MREFRDKVAVVTGGASGIGLALGRAFGAEGMKLYLDAKQVGFDAFDGGLMANRETIVVGGSNWRNRDNSGDRARLKISDPFNGYIDEVAFYGEALSVEQIRELITNGPVDAGASSAGLSGGLADYAFAFPDDALQVSDTRSTAAEGIAYWDLNETSGDHLQDSAGTPQNGSKPAARH